MIGVNVEGVQGLQKKFASVAGAIPAAVQALAIELRQMVIEGTPVDTGLLKRSWGQIEKHESGYSFENPLSYAATIEYGLYKSKGPKTVKVKGKIYSSQAPGGIIAPLLESKAVKQQLFNVFIRKLEEIISGAA